MNARPNPYALTFSDLTRTLVRAVEPQRVEYRDFVITYNPTPIPDRQFDWQYEHKDFDGAPDAGDRRYGHCRSANACKNEIDEYYDDIEFAPGPPLPAEDEPNGWNDASEQYEEMPE